MRGRAYQIPVNLSRPAASAAHGRVLCGGVCAAPTATSRQIDEGGKQKLAKWSHLKILLDLDTGEHKLRMVNKLTESHVISEKIPKVKLKHAAKVFSQKVQGALRFSTIPSCSNGPAAGAKRMCAYATRIGFNGYERSVNLLHSEAESVMLDWLDLMMRDPTTRAESNRLDHHEIVPNEFLSDSEDGCIPSDHNLIQCAHLTRKGSDSYSLSEEDKKKPIPAQAVLRLCKPIYNSNRNVTTDNWYSSIELSEELKNKGLTTVEIIKVPLLPPIDENAQDGKLPETKENTICPSRLKEETVYLCIAVIKPVCLACTKKICVQCAAKDRE
ncbi:hypothetical protein EVAR_92007_1 [Eumeta japonica]|uniref:Uncharacterized protein n=1 Tax=Eumeta variegata TaxID=151549 RepID=A0A4C1ZUR4_EUMVA|nr:hypothetical protein EVAR_92007_1 [Eumeta japonica]